MSFISGTAEISSIGVFRRSADFCELCKPRVVVMVLITAFVGFYIGSEEVPNYVRMFNMLFGTALAAGGTLALNQFLECDTDAMMRRTQHRPIPAGRVQPFEALWFGLALVFSGLAYLFMAVNAMSAGVTAFIAIVYLLLYTPLKRLSSMCVPVGAVPGALPPVIGWAAARGSLDIDAWVLFAIMFLWQVPHTLAIAWLYRDDYAKAGMKFLPAIEPEGWSTRRQVLIYCTALLAVSLLPTLLGLAGAVYFAVAVLLGLLFLTTGLQLAIESNMQGARRLLLASLIYLPVLLLAMALNRMPV